MSYKLLEHTADIGIEIQENILEDLFASAAQGMTEIILAGDMEPKKDIVVDIEADSLKELLHDWLSEINYLFSVKEMVFRKFTISPIHDNHLHAVCKGEKYDHQRHTFHTEIKAVTYHQFQVEYQEENKKWYAKIYFDL